MEAELLVVIFILFVLLIAVKGGVTGFFGAVESTIFLILLSVLTIAVTPKICGVLGSFRLVNAYLEQSAQEIVSENTEKLAAGEDVWLLRNVSLSDELKAALQSGDADAVRSEPVQSGLRDAVKKFFIYTASVIFTIALFIVVLLLLTILLNKLVKVPDVRKIDRVMGFVLGLLEGMIAVFMLLALLHLFEFTETGTALLQYVRRSSLLSMLDDCNLVYHAARHVMGLH